MPEVVVHPAVPLLGELLERELVAQHRLLQLEAQDDVQVVGRLVRLDPDQRRLDEVGLAVPLLDLVPGELGLQLLQAREEVAPERQRAADEVLPHAALRLVHPERDASCERRALERLVDLVLVEPVPELVHRPEEPAEMLGEVARRDPDVTRRRARRERVHGRIEPPGVVGVAEGAHHLELEDLLRRNVEVVRRKRLGLQGGDLLDERRLMLLDVVEQAPDLLRRHVALVVVEHDVVRLVLRRRSTRCTACAGRGSCAARAGRS